MDVAVLSIVGASVGLALGCGLGALAIKYASKRVREDRDRFEADLKQAEARLEKRRATPAAQQGCYNVPLSHPVQH